MPTVDCKVASEECTATATVAQNQNQGSNVGNISVEPRNQPTNVGVITRGGATIGNDGKLTNILPIARKKV